MNLKSGVMKSILFSHMARNATERNPCYMVKDVSYSAAEDKQQRIFRFLSPVKITLKTIHSSLCIVNDSL